MSFAPQDFIRASVEAAEKERLRKKREREKKAAELARKNRARAESALPTDRKLLEKHGFLRASEIALGRAALARQPETSTAQATPSRDERIKQGRASGMSRIDAEFLAATGRKPAKTLAAGLIGSNRVTREASEIVSGLPAALYVMGRDLAKAPVELIQGKKRTSFERNVATPLAKSFAHKYGPLFRGDPGTTLHRIGQEPVTSALDALLVAGGASQLAKLPKLVKTPGTLRERAVAARRPDVREVATGETKVQFPVSPTPLTEAGQRRIDRLSERMEKARKAGVPIPPSLTADVRAAKRQYRLMNQQLRRERAGLGQEAKAVKGIPRKARTAAFYEAQLPVAARGGEGLARLEQRFRDLARQTAREGTAVARAQAATPTKTYEQAVAQEQRIGKALERAEAKVGRQEFTAEQRKLIGTEETRPGFAEEALPTAGEIGSFTVTPEGRTLRPIGSARLDRLRAAHGVAKERVERFNLPRPVRRNPEAEAREVRRLMIEAEKVKRSAGKPYDPKAIASAGKLMADREKILQEAGFDVGAWTGKEFLARELGYKPTGEEVFVGHRTGGGRRVPSPFPRGVAGKAQPPPGVGKERTGTLFRSGGVLSDPREIVRDWERAQAYKVQTEVRSYLHKVGEKIGPEGPNPRWYIVNPAGQKLPRRWKDPDEIARHKLEGFTLDDVLRQDIEALARNTIIRADDPGAAEFVAAARRQGVEPRQVRPSVAHKLIPRMTGAGRASRSYDLASDLIKFSLIYANPGYIPANLIGNFTFALTHQGATLPPNMVRAVRRMTGTGAKGLTRAERLEFRDRLFGEIGLGPTAAITSRAAGAEGVASRAVHRFAMAEGRVADDFPRLSGWIREARKQGVRTPEQQLKFLRKAAQRDPDAMRLANEIRDRMQTGMVDFERMGPRGKEIARRYMFVWAWITGASRYPFRLAADMPVRTALGADVATSVGQQPGLEPPPLPAWFGPGAKKFGDRIFNPRVISTVSTPLELMQTLSGALAGKSSESLIDVANPLLRLGFDVARGQTRFGQNVGAIEAGKEGLRGLLGPDVPAGKLVQELIDPSKAPKLYGPQDRIEVLKRRIGRGAFPIRIDEREALKSARRDMGRMDRFKWDSRDFRSRLIEAGVKAGQLSPGAKRIESKKLKEALSLRERRYGSYAKLEIKRKDPDYQLKAYQADQELSVKLGLNTRQEADTNIAREERRWATIGDDENRRKLVSEYVSGLRQSMGWDWFGEKRISDVLSSLKDEGIVVERPSYQ